MKLVVYNYTSALGGASFWWLTLWTQIHFATKHQHWYLVERESFSFNSFIHSFIQFIQVFVHSFNSFKYLLQWYFNQKSTSQPKINQKSAKFEPFSMLIFQCQIDFWLVVESKGWFLVDHHHCNKIKNFPTKYHCEGRWGWLKLNVESMMIQFYCVIR